MSNVVEKRWGIVALAVAMFFVTMVNAGINGNKTSFYYWVWMMVGWYGYKGNLEQIKSLMKYLIWLNLGVVVLVMMFFEEQTVGYITRGGDKQSMIFGVLVMLVPKVFIWMYCDKELKETAEANSEEVQVKREPLQPTQKKVNNYIKNMSEAGQEKFLNHNKNYIQTKKTEIIEEAYQRMSPITVKKTEIKETLVEVNVKPSVSEDMCWENAFNEYNSESRNKGLWVRLYAENNAEEEKIKIAYLKIRAQQIFEEEKQKQQLLINEIKKREFLAEKEREKQPQQSYEVGMKIFNGFEDTAPSPVEAFPYLYEAAIGGIDKAQFQISLMYWKGNGVVQNKSEAYAWCRIAANSIFDAKEKLQNFSKEITYSEVMESDKLAKNYVELINAK